MIHAGESDVVIVCTRGSPARGRVGSTPRPARGPSAKEADESRDLRGRSNEAVSAWRASSLAGARACRRILSRGARFRGSRKRGSGWKTVAADPGACLGVWDRRAVGSTSPHEPGATFCVSLLIARRGGGHGPAPSVAWTGDRTIPTGRAAGCYAHVVALFMNECSGWCAAAAAEQTADNCKFRGAERRQREWGGKG